MRLLALLLCVFCTQAKKSKVLVHCKAGMSRSVSVVLAYLMRMHGWSLERAVQEVSPRRCIHPNPGFVRQLMMFREQHPLSAAETQMPPALLPRDFAKGSLVRLTGLIARPDLNDTLVLVLGRVHGTDDRWQVQTMGSGTSFNVRDINMSTANLYSRRDR